MSITILGFAGVTTLMLCMLLMPLVSKLALTWDVIDHPDDRKVHASAIPRLGGVAIGVSFLVCCVLYIPVNFELVALLSGLIVILMTGIADDVWHLNPYVKLTGQIIACLVFIIISGDSIDSFGDFLGTGPVPSGILAIPLTVFCMVGVINALNMSDGLDGLAGGLSLIACFFLAYFAIISQYWLNLFLLTILAGSLLGFLYYNFHPARIFMGDTGSMVLGYVLSAICILFQNVDDVYPVYPISLALILGLPICDTLFVMSKRALQGGNPFYADNSHLHHRLLTLGISHPGVVTGMYLLMVCYGLLAIFLHPLAEWQQFYIGISFGIVLFASVVVVQRRGLKSPAWLSEGLIGEDRFIAVFDDLTNMLGKSVALMSWLIPLFLVVPLLFFPSIRSDSEWLSFMIAFVILLLYPWKNEEQRVQWTHGLIYISIFMLLVILNVYGPVWTPIYLRFITAIVLLWVIMKMLFKRHGDVVLTSGFEVLMIFIAWCIPTLLLQALNFPQEVQRMLLHSCLEAVPFLLAMKIIIRSSMKADRFLIICITSIFMLIGIRQYIAPLH